MSDLTRASIESMTAGVEMDALIAVRVLGLETRNGPNGKPTSIVIKAHHRCDPLPPYSRDIGRAWEVAEASDNNEHGSKRWYYRLDSAVCGGWSVHVHDEAAWCARGSGKTDINVYDNNPATALCKAALIASLCPVPPIDEEMREKNRREFQERLNRMCKCQSDPDSTNTGPQT